MQKLYDKNYIFKGKYEGWYCVGCEEYKEVEPDTTAPVCDIHQKPLEFIAEEIYYFALSKFQDQIISLIGEDKIVIQPEARKNEVLAFLKEPLRDLPVTRTKVSWGIPAPFDTSQTIYVWFDALLYYLSYGGVKIDSEASGDVRTWWPTDLQLIGKDILRFHAIIWPAMLLALDLPPLRQLFVHGFFTINGQKMSKSLGNVIRPHEVVDRYGVQAARYLIVSAVPFGADGDISFEKLDAVYTSQLANGLGNLLQRTIVLINKYGIKPQVQSSENLQLKEAYLSNDINKALTLTFALVDDANRYIATEQPWAITNDALRETVLVKVYEELLKISEALVPIMPETAASIKKQLETLQPEPLFPRLP
jgi:methionyl-tRNA synthetase